MSDQPVYPSEPGAPALGTYPVTLTAALPDRIARWRPIVQWILLLPHYVVLWAFGILASIVVFVAWVCGVVLGRIPKELLELLALYVRYTARVNGYYSFLHDRYPPFSFDASLPDPLPDAPLRVDVQEQAAGRSRLRIFFRLLLAIPQLVVLWFVSVAALVVLFIAFFAVTILGRWPEGLRTFTVGYVRWNTRVSAYLYLLTDEYPPFSLS